MSKTNDKETSADGAGADGAGKVRKIVRWKFEAGIVGSESSDIRDLMRWTGKTLLRDDCPVGFEIKIRRVAATPKEAADAAILKVCGEDDGRRIIGEIEKSIESFFEANVPALEKVE